MKDPEELAVRLGEAKKALAEGEFVLIGGGAGLSDAAGIHYAGQRFTDNFGAFIEKYGMEDMYSAGFYPFETEEERWGYWARHIKLNRYDPPALPLYRKLLSLVRNKEYFVITTNVDHQFYKAAFQPERIFAVQGDYGLFQCAKGCHEKLYPNREEVLRMCEQTRDCRILRELVPRCPVCGGLMDIHIRKNQYFVEEASWHEAQKNYESFLRKAEGHRLVLLELGVGFNTPGIIRFPFEQLTYAAKDALLLRFNAHHSEGAPENRNKTVAFREEMEQLTEALLEN